MSKLDLRYWFELMLRRRVIAMETFAVLFGLVVLGTALWPPEYESVAEILVQDNRAQLLVSPNLRDSSPKDATIVVNPVNEQDLNSEVELISSLQLIKRAIAGLRVPAADSGLTGTLFTIAKTAASLPIIGYGAMHSTPNLTPMDRLALKISRDLSATVIKRSNIIEVSYRSHDPQWCKALLTSLIAQYLDHHALISHDPQAQELFSQQAHLLQRKLYDSQEKLRAYQVQTGISNLDEQKQALINQLSDLQNQYDKNAAQLASAQQETVSLQQVIAKTPQRIGKEVRSVQNVALAQIKPQVLQLQAERAELLSRYEPTSKRIREIDAKLAEAQAILNRENHLEVQEQSTDLNPVWITVDSNLTAATTNAAALAAQRASLASAIQKVQQQMVYLVNSGVELDRLEHQVQMEQDAYISYVRKSEEARAAQALNVNKILNIAVAQSPQLPMRPVSPVVWLNLLAGLMVAAVAGVGAAYWEECSDAKLYTTADIASVSGLNTIAVLSDES
jgi:uncharacterized protein involved in exopolysaccharide biosynthesis